MLAAAENSELRTVLRGSAMFKKRSGSQFWKHSTPAGPFYFLSICYY